jgi:hypothetical protein
MFGTTEHRQRSIARAEAALQRATAWLGPSDGPPSDRSGSHGPASDGPGTHGPASTPGASYGAALDALDAAYARAGAPGGWSGHYQGGPIGFAQREFEMAPGQHASRWYAEPIMAGHAVAWNPSLPGGAKSEDTYLLSAGGVRQRMTISPGWPTEPDDTMRPPRPAVLEVGL